MVPFAFDDLDTLVPELPPENRTVTEAAIRGLLIPKTRGSEHVERRNHDAAFKARMALEALKGACTVSEVATAYEVHPAMIHQWKKAVLEGAAGIFERGGKAAATAEIAEDTVRDLHAKIVR
jgi:transposase-like protein